MCAYMIDLKKVRTRIKELEEELKATWEDYEEEIEVLVDKNANLTMKLAIFMGGPTPVDEDEELTTAGCTDAEKVKTRIIEIEEELKST